MSEVGEWAAVVRRGLSVSWVAAGVRRRTVQPPKRVGSTGVGCIVWRMGTVDPRPPPRVRRWPTTDVSIPNVLSGEWVHYANATAKVQRERGQATGAGAFRKASSVVLVLTAIR